jgi:4-amino-4-deoxy-L-arabinose transferase-like glycosyltransferase
MKSKQIIISRTILIIPFVLLSLLAFALVYFPTQRFRIGISPDSIQYIGTARNLIAGAGFATYNNSPLLLYPPFYPLILALFGWIFKTDPLLLTNILNSMLFGLIIFFSGILIYNLTQKSYTFAFLGSLAIVFSIPLYGVTTMAWSETLLVFLFMLFFILSEMYYKNHRIINLIFLAFVTAMACLTKYVGLVLIPVGIISIFFTSKIKTKEKILHSISFAIISSLPIGIWFVRNLLISGTFSGPRHLSSYTFLDNIHSMLVTLFSWYFVPPLNSKLFMIVVIILVVGLTIWYCLREKPLLKKYISSVQFILILFILLYIVLLLASSKSGFGQLIDNRYLSPIFIPLTLLILNIVQYTTIYLQKHFRSKIVFPTMALILLIFISYSIKTTLDNSKKLDSFRMGFNTQNPLTSSTLMYLIDHPSISHNCKIYTNNPIDIDFIAHFPAKMSPSKVSTSLSSIVTKNTSQLLGIWPEQNACLVWFDSFDKNTLYSLSDLRMISNIVLIAEFNDGAIYSVSKK